MRPKRNNWNVDWTANKLRHQGKNNKYNRFGNAIGYSEFCCVSEMGRKKMWRKVVDEKKIPSISVIKCYFRHFEVFSKKHWFIVQIESTLGNVSSPKWRLYWSLPMSPFIRIHSLKNIFERCPTFRVFHVNLKNYINKCM